MATGAALMYWAAAMACSSMGGSTGSGADLMNPFQEEFTDIMVIRKSNEML
jgi:hypothetical protein